MEYLSSKQVAAKWGISPTRVVILCKQNKIPGAVLVGKSWMIPNTIDKPKDGRKKADEYKNNSKFIFPLFSYLNYEDELFVKILDDEQKEFLQAEKVFLNMDIEEAESLFKPINEKTKNVYTKIGCLYYLCKCAICKQQYPLYQKLNKELQNIFEKDFEHKDELKYITADIDLVAKGYEPKKAKVKIDPDKYGNRYLSTYLSTYAFYETLTDLLNNKIDFNTTLYEICVSIVEKDKCYFVAEKMHIYLALIYRLLNKQDEVTRHVKKLLDIAYEHNIFAAIVPFYAFLELKINSVINDYPVWFKEKMIKSNKIYLLGINGLASYLNKKKQNVHVLKSSDYEYLSYALAGNSNKEIAITLGISEAAVSKKYQSLCEKFDVSNKAQLLIKFRSYVDNPYLIKNK